ISASTSSFGACDLSVASTGAASSTSPWCLSFTTSARPHSSSGTASLSIPSVHKEVRVHESAAFGHVAGPGGHRRAQHRALEHEGMELAIFAAGVDALRHALHEVRIEDAARPLPRRAARIDAHDPGAQPARGPVLGERSRRQAPDRKQQLHAAAGELPLAIAPYVLEKQ